MKTNEFVPSVADFFFMKVIGSTCFKKSVCRLDPSFSDSQCRNLFNKLKNSDGLVEVETLLRNVTGSEQDTVDFRNKMYK